MEFERTQAIGGIPITRVRAFLRDRQGAAFATDRVGQFFDLDPTDAKAWIDSALQCGFVQPTRRHNNFYQAAPLGVRLIASPLCARISRESGQQLVEELLRRAEHTASAGERWNYLVEIEMMALFGSALGGRESDIGDVDILYKLQWLPEIKQGDQKLDQLCLDLFDRDNRRSLQVLDYAIWPSLKLLRALRNRNPYLSLHNWTQAEVLDAEVMVIFEWPFGRVADPREMSAKDFMVLYREREEAKTPLPAPRQKRRR